MAVVFEDGVWNCEACGAFKTERFVCPCSRKGLGPRRGTRRDDDGYVVLSDEAAEFLERLTNPAAGGAGVNYFTNQHTRTQEGGAFGAALHAALNRAWAETPGPRVVTYTGAGVLLIPRSAL